MKAVICDIDGTLALSNGRGPFEWDRVGEDLPNEPVIEMVTALVCEGYAVILVSGRSNQCRDQTREWLNEHVPFTWDCPLYMRPDGDYRPDTELKRDIYGRYVAGLDVLCVFDDRDQVVKMWRELGLTCLQVADGDF